MSDPKKPQAFPPETISDEAKIGAPADVAAGPKAVWSSLRFAQQKAGLVAGARLLAQVNQKGTDGFDCPSCAWPDPDGDRHVAEFCEQGARAVADEATRSRVTPAFFAQHSLADLAAHDAYWLNQQGRLTHPMVRQPGASHYAPIEWDDAFTLIGEALNALDDPNEALFYTSGRASNEAAFVLQLFARQFGTNNLPDCSNMCHESSGVGLIEAVGVGKGTVTLHDFEHCDALFIIGQNPGTNHPRMLTYLEDAKKRGATIVSINPLREAGLQRFKQPQDLNTPAGLYRNFIGSGTRITDLFLPVRVGADVALLTGIAKALLEAEEETPGTVLDHAFIADHTEGFTAFAEALRAADWAVIIEESGIEEAEIRQAAQVLHTSERTIFCWAMGVTQHRHAVSNIQMIANLALMTGNIGKQGAGLCPVRGHSNVQGDRTMGIHARPPVDFLDRLAAAYTFEPPRAHGFEAVESIQAMHDGRAKVFVSLGGNFLTATPDTAFTAEALQRCRLTVQISTKLNRAHLVTGETALILPCLGRTEVDQQPSGPQFITMENSMGIVHLSQGSRKPASEALRSEPAILCGIAQATLGAQTTVDWQAMADDYDRIRDGIAQVVQGCEDLNTRVREPGGFYLPNAAREGRFQTDIGRARFTVHAIPRHALAEGQLMMMTLRSHDQFNTTIYGMDDRYRGIWGTRRVVMLNPEDMKAQGLRKGDVVDLTSHFEGETRTVNRFLAVPFPIPKRCAATYFPEANPLVPIGAFDPRSKTPASKSVVITIAPTATS